MEASARTGRRSGWVTLAGVLFVISGGFDLIWALVALGVSLGGSDQTVLGDLSVHNLEGLGVAGLIIGGLQLYAGFGILNRNPSARVVGLILSVLAILIHFGYYRVLDGWAFTGLFINLVIVLILCLRREEFVV
jgi:hypothetical protein